MATTSARSLRLLSLLGTGRTWPGPELCERLGVSERTLRRDVEVLRELGYAIEPIKGVDGGYRLGSGGALPPMVLDEDQVVAIVVALQTASTVLRGIDESSRRALATVRQVMPKRLRIGAGAVTATGVPNQWEFPAEPIEAGLVREVGAAVRQQQVLRLDYENDVDELVGLRVEPHHLVVWAARWYLVAYDPATSAWRVLRLDRIRVGPPTNVRFTERQPPPGGLVALVKQTPDRGDRLAAWPCQGRVVLELPASVVAEFAPGGAVVEYRTEHKCQLSMGAWSWTGLAGLFITFDAAMSDIEPVELRGAFSAVRERLPDNSLDTAQR